MSAVSNPKHWSGVLFDGSTSTRHLVNVSPIGDSLMIVFIDSSRRELISFSQLILREKDKRRNEIRLGHRQLPGWRLILDDFQSIDMLANLAPHFKRDSVSLGVSRFAIITVVSLITIAGIYFSAGYLSRWAAARVPDSWAETIGEQVVEYLAHGSEFCENPDGRVAIDDLDRRLRSPMLENRNVTIRVLDSGIVNAFAAPGGKVIIMRGLIDAAQSSDEFAAVMAHELGHVQYRHPMRGLIQALGIGFIIQTMGGDTATVADTFLTLARSRDHENEADEEALAAMLRNKISPVGFANFFERLQGDEPKEEEADGGFGADIFSYLSTHPASENRAAKARAAIDPLDQTYRPALDEAQWKSVKNICGESPSESQEQNNNELEQR